ncbi:peroxiredoxin family protein [Winogradskyella arenosi]|uniref:Peroxiredoxin n=1 Tax=Winogradskyella arenosi TaxID=533325 RepID=A0A368ZGS5_9FLAO|nr:TlpA disulfide reductase family protein [Winogradskyella arenosi]RCW91224.1 peroxiredoxin [Winogradskyella arenosi]
MRYLLITLLCFACFSCKNESKTEDSVTADSPVQPLKNGMYRGVLEVKDGEELPFNFKVTSTNELEVYNAEEVINVDEVTYSADSVLIKLPVFEGYITAKRDGNNLKGQFIIESLERSVAFTANYGVEKRFETAEVPTVNVSGVWETTFSVGKGDEAYMAKGIFTQKDDLVTGTFRTATGDYRFLEGVMDGNTMKLSAFDGSHAFLFTATVNDSTMEGTFYSGNHWKEPFMAKRNPSFELPEADDLTFLKEGYERLAFEFPDTSGNLVSLDDERFKGKVVVVQIMGSWCPNCLDESKYYAEFYKQNKSKDIAFVGLAFEYAKTEEAAFSRIDRLKERVGIDYPILLAQYGSSDKEKAQEKLPMLNHVLSYPTSIFIDKTGKVRKIHTGFNGPATGEKYTAFKAEFERFVAELLAE